MYIYIYWAKIQGSCAKQLVQENINVKEICSLTRTGSWSTTDEIKYIFNERISIAYTSGLRINAMQNNTLIIQSFSTVANPISAMVDSMVVWHLAIVAV